MERLIRNVEEFVDLYKDPKTGIAFISNGKTGVRHSAHPNIDSTGSVRGMKKLGYWGEKDKTVRSNGYIYNVTKKIVDDMYDQIAADHCTCVGCYS